MIEGKPDGDIFAMDVSRFGKYATDTYTIEKANEFYQNRFHLLCPNEEWPAARPNKVSAFYDRLQQANAVFGSSYGLEMPLWFAPQGSAPIEIPSFHRSNSHEPVGEECRAVRDSVGLLDITSIAKYEVSGPDAVDYMDYLFASRLPAIGRIRMAPLLQPCGYLKGDLTIMRVAEDKFMITGSGYLQEFHMMWFERYAAGHDVRIVNRSDELSAISIAGPESRELLRSISSHSVDNDVFPFMSVRSMDVGMAPCRVARISFTGELGYEIYVPNVYAHSLYDSILNAGGKFGLRPFGIRALLSLGMEKGFGIWSREFTPEYTPAMCGFDRFIDYEKADFVGREAALADRDAEHEHRLVGLEIDAGDADAGGYEPVWCKDELAGFITSGAYGHTVEKSLALAYVKTPFIDSSNGDLSVHVLDERRPAVMISGAAYDPSGSRMRS
jgi:dimethylglycine dehydrogenase